MADTDVSKLEKKEKEYFTDTPQAAPGFFLKGSHQYDWGLKNRLSRVFNPKDGRTVMLAFDHGYFQGPTTGLERVDQTILPLEPYADCLMLTRGIQRSIIPASTQKAIALRASGGTSMVSPMEEWEGEIDGKKVKFGRPGFEPLSNESTALQHRRSHPPQRQRSRRAGLHRQRLRAPVAEEPDRPRRRGEPLWHRRHGRRRRGPRDGPHAAVFPPRHPHHGGTRRERGEVLLHGRQTSTPSRAAARCRS